MKNCLQCGEKLTHIIGRKEKSFCDVNCRNKHFYAKRKQILELYKTGAIVSSEKEEPQKEQPKSNFTIDTRPENPHKQQELSNFMQKRQQLKNGGK